MRIQIASVNYRRAFFRAPFNSQINSEEFFLVLIRIICFEKINEAQMDLLVSDQSSSPFVVLR